MHYWNNIRFSRQKLYWSIKYLITMNIRTYIHHKVLVLYTHIYLFINRPFHKRQWNWLILVSPRMRLNVWCPRMRLNVWWVPACEAECMVPTCEAECMVHACEAAFIVPRVKLNVWCPRVRLHLLFPRVKLNACCPRVRLNVWCPCVRLYWAVLVVSAES